ncbi:Pentatricopeptide repeat-containing protein At5g46680 [Linum perenne]
MKSKGYYDRFAYCTAVSALLKVRRVEEAATIMAELINYGIELDLASYNTLMNLLWKEGKVENAYNLIDEMEKKGLKGDKYTHTILVDGLCKKGDIEEALRGLRIMKNMWGFDSIAATNSVIDRLVKVGNHELAMKMFQSMEGRDSFTYSSLVYQLSKDRGFRYALKHLLFCVEKGIKLLPARGVNEPSRAELCPARARLVWFGVWLELGSSSSLARSIELELGSANFFLARARLGSVRN